MNLSVRKARMGDIRAIHALLMTSSADGLLLPRSLTDLYGHLRDFFVVEGDGATVGCGALSIIWENMAEVRSLAVAAHARRKGCGRLIVEACIAEARELDIHRLFALTYQLPFFNALGFSIVEKEVLPQKVWVDCVNCPKFPDCDETAVLLEIYPASRDVAVPEGAFYMRITNLKPLISEEAIQTRVKEMAGEISTLYKDEPLVVVCVLKGASFFYIDLCRCMNCAIDMDFIAVSSYGASAQSTGVVRLIKDLDNNITGRHVVIVEDIIDSGLTMQYLRQLFGARNPASITTISFLDKASRHPESYKTDMCGFEIPDEFVVGYGLDYANYYRNLPYIGILKPECYK